MEIFKKLEKFNMRDSSEFIGLFLGNAMLGFLIITVILTLILAILLTKFFWIILWGSIIPILIILLPVIIDFFASFVANRIILKDYIYNRNLMYILDIYKICAACLEGLSGSFGRLIIAFFALLIGMLRFDASLIPEWIDKIVKLDSLANSFNSCVLIHNYFNNPIKHAFTFHVINSYLKRLSYRAYREKKFKESKELELDLNLNLNLNLNRIQLDNVNIIPCNVTEEGKIISKSSRLFTKKMWLLIILLNNPKLKYYRDH